VADHSDLPPTSDQQTAAAMPWVWLVGFVEGGRWTQRLLKRGYGHCWCARPLWNDLWLYVEWSPGRINVGPVTLQMIDAACARATTVFQIDTLAGQRAHDVPLPMFGWWHCVRLVVDCLGIAMPRWPTPWGLVRALRAHPDAREAPKALIQGQA
jgi:hypothetical protein